jgi:UPF0271 protein
MSLDLNADLGESFGRWTLGDDAALMPYLTSANVAAGFHGGDPHVLRRTVGLAVEQDEISDLVLYQSGAVRAFAEAAGAELRHVKPHGSLYTMVVEDAELARALCETVAALGVALLMPPEMAQAAEAAGIRFVPEGYVDLDYDADGRLILERVKQPRDPVETGRRAVAWAEDGRVGSICVHGDGPNAVELAAAVRAALAEAGVDVRPL